ncbi:hypothetical protein NQ315_002414 [Exocentrus adspersus]|uniref:Spindle assembly abnormal protein 6 N-terminal domain-containing protein n=1 Tax=Exocentrus adspersus TaxID=1586481 RepID=A0AAV8VU04_9CUCU|nr:hypothetical protein NQ315_002414 [Exocentrus adspersus]
MRVNQNLDINFNEFKCNLIEMLQQFQKREMLLKCEVANQKCTLIFYCKSKIKSIVYLTIDLHVTNQKEIFAELIHNMQSIQNMNERLKKQLQSLRKSVSEKDQEIQRLALLKNELQEQFHKNVEQLNNLFNNKICEVEDLLIKKIVYIKFRVVKLVNDVNVLKEETSLKVESSRNLVKTMESLRVDADKNHALMNRLREENNSLTAVKAKQDKMITDLQKTVQDKDVSVVELQNRNGELQGDMEKLSVMMAQKKATIDELSKDLVQANQMLVNFNNHYDAKSKQVEELQAIVAAKDSAIKEQKLRTNELLREFENYKVSFNEEEQGKLKHEFVLAQNKIDELEGALRKANKINVLLTEKINNANFGHR